MQGLVRRAGDLGLIQQRPEAAVDATGFETHHASFYYAQRKSRTQRKRRRWPKLSVVCDTRSHLFISAAVSTGPSNDGSDFPQIMTEASALVSFDRVLGDSAYDAESFHALCRERLGIRSSVFAINRRRGGRKWPTTRYRRQMKRHFHKRIYGQRWQVESAFSQHKRRLGSALRARTEQAKQRECFLRVLTHNLMLIRFAA